MSDSDLLIGLDLGTTATKCVLLGPERGVVAQDARPVALSSARPGWAEEDPDEWIRNAYELIPAVLAAAGASGRDVRAIGVSGMVPALLCLDAAGRPLRFSIQQNDTRAADQVARLRAALPAARVLARTGSAVTQQSVGPKVAWLREHEPDVVRRTAAICGSYDYLARRLVARAGPGAPVEANWALESGLYDFGEQQWALWRQIIADVLALPVQRSDHPAGAALGAAFAAGMAVGVFSSWDSIATLAPPATRTEPDSSTAGLYDELYTVYRSLYPALLDQQHTLARF